MPPDPKLLAAQAQAMRAQGRLGEAIGLYRQATLAAPTSPAAEHNLAAALGDAGRWAEAETHIRRAFAKGGTAAESWLVLARCLQSRAAFDEAEQAFVRAIERRATLYEAHVDLAQLRWIRTGDLPTALAGLDRALASAPGNARLLHAKAKVLEGAGRPEDAFALVAAHTRTTVDDLALVVTASQLAAALGEGALALADAERAVAIAPQDAVAAATLVTACLAGGDAARAETLALQLVARAPQDQHAIALLATAWRLRGDARYHELYDYDRLVQTSFLDAPSGWRTLQNYVDDLRLALARAHVTRTHPFNQSIRHGSQVPDILAIEDPAIAALPQALDGSIRRYLARLGEGGDPLRRRNEGGYAFNGMWSIRMQAGGYHVDHVHPAGWISSACYIETPDVSKGHEGWIRFGAPGVRTATPLPAEHFIKPEPGMLVLFPSYMWHGVIPYTDTAARMTFAFDLEPARAGAS